MKARTKSRLLRLERWAAKYLEGDLRLERHEALQKFLIATFEDDCNQTDEVNRGDTLSRILGYDEKTDVIIRADINDFQRRLWDAYGKACEKWGVDPNELTIDDINVLLSNEPRRK